MKDENYLPIDDYGIIGNMRSAALVGLNGSIDWFCFPHFDSPSIFAKILDSRIGGHFCICPLAEFKTKQFYWPDTNVLITRYLTDEGIVEVSDFMPVGPHIKTEYDYRIIRRVTGINGKVRMRMECKPAFNYARDSHELDISEEGATFRNTSLAMDLDCTRPLEKSDGMAVVEFSVGQDASENFILHKSDEESPVQRELGLREVEEDLHQTLVYWRNWISGSTYKGRWRETVHRSALILKLLTFEPTGAIVAAVTCSLPEGIGGERNWDYRYTWIRDAAFTVYAFMRLGFTREATAFMQWVGHRLSETTGDEPLQIMYGIDGRHELEEEELNHLEGYMKSRPVRIGNGAYDQLQLDIYGELMDSVYLFNKYAYPIGYQGWKNVCKIADWVVENWKEKDEGIWEVRSGKQEFVYSKLMCWVALDRAVRLSLKSSLPADLSTWISTRDEIYEEIMEKGWSEERQAFIQYYGSKSLDAANLMLPLVFFIAPSDPRIQKTLEATLQPPEKGGLVTNSHVYRYNTLESPDGLEGHEGTFNICTFWLVEALTRAGKADPAKLEEARLMFEQMLGYANHVGIYSEEIGITGEALGNTPQAFTHLALISAAFNLDRTLG
jgi:GH15 family glucan-1,4-alpha-glucosidase